MMAAKKKTDHTNISRLNMAAYKSRNSYNPQKQHGLALPLTLILLLVMTLIGIATLRSTTMEENMTANSRLRQVAFNAAESALREAERVAEGLSGRKRRVLFFGRDASGEPRLGPDESLPNIGDTCQGDNIDDDEVDLDSDEGGFCTPAQFTSPASVDAAGERWEDSTLDVWNNPDRHIEYRDFDNTNLNLNGVIEAPKYIIEFLGNYDYKEPNVRLATEPSIRPEFAGVYRGNCRSTEDNSLTPPNDSWPYCAADPSVYRITVRATAGPTARQAVVMLQSTLRIP